jgi:hypothetical protein
MDRTNTRYRVSEDHADRPRRTYRVSAEIQGCVEMLLDDYSPVTQKELTELLHSLRDYSVSYGSCSSDVSCSLLRLREAGRAAATGGVRDRSPVWIAVAES